MYMYIFFRRILMKKIILATVIGVFMSMIALTDSHEENTVVIPEKSVKRMLPVLFTTVQKWQRRRIMEIPL